MVFYWDILHEKRHKGYPYTNIIKILGRNNKLVIDYLDNLIEFRFTKYNNDGLIKYIELKTVGYDTRTKIHNLMLRIFDKTKDVYIANISKSEKISGKAFVKLAEIISKKIGASYVYLADATSVLCNNNDKFNKVDLSLYLLFKNNKTYYQQFGYKLAVVCKYCNLPRMPNKSAENTLQYFLNKVNKLELSNINKNNSLVLRELKKSIVNNYKIKIKTTSWSFTKQYVNDIYSLYNDFIVYANIYNFLPKKGNFVNELLKLHNKNCNIYNFFIETIKDYIKFNQKPFGYIYEFPNNTYKLEEIYLLLMLIEYRENLSWNGHFVKKLK